MTNFMRWLFFGVLFLSIWLSVLTKRINHQILEDHPKTVLYFPVIFVLAFGIYSFTVIMYRVYTFNDCKEAALELRNQIEEAKADLQKKGFKFEVDS